MNRIPNQFFGLGDILFLVPLIRKWQSQGDTVLWPIIPEYLNIQKNFPDINFVDKTKYPIPYDNRIRFPWNIWTVEPLRWADLHKPPPSNCMRAKYDLYGEDFMMWKELCWQRDTNAEERLFNLMCPFIQELSTEGECKPFNFLGEYNLISNRFGSHTQGQYKVPIEVDNGLPNVYLEDLPGYNLLDWSMIIENATYIHTVGSSINYVMEVLELKAKEVHLYMRQPIEKHFKYYDYLLQKTYHYHTLNGIIIK